MKYTIRPCRTLQELAAAVNLQKAIWGYAAEEVYPLRLFINLRRIGGHVLGAFAAGGRLVGFVASMPAWHGRHRYFHSLSLGVAPGHQNQGLGRALKLQQRRVALQAGVDTIEWTFDPLRAKNAYLNVVRLGAIARQYLPNYYGHVASRLQSGLPSDRLIAEWRLKSARVVQTIRGRPSRSPAKQPTAEVAIPADLGTLLTSHPKHAKAWQSAVRKQLQGLFAEGLAVTGFVYGPKFARYLLEPYAP